MQLESLGLRDQWVVLALLDPSVAPVRLGQLELLEVLEHQVQLETPVLQVQLVESDWSEELGLPELQGLADPTVSRGPKDPLVDRVPQGPRVVLEIMEQQVPLE